MKTSLLLALILVTFASLQAADKPNEKRKVLADHQTVATFEGIRAQKCMGLTSLCPDRCGHSGDFATFKITGYVGYQKLGEYGDPRAESFVFQIEDNMHNLKVTKELAAAARDLKSGDTVQLNWRHEYVTRTEGGGSSSFPERPIVLLKKITKEEGDKLLKNAK